MAEPSFGQARIAGLLYLGTIAGGLFAEVMVRGRLVVDGDGMATARNIAAHPLLYRAGELGDLFMLCCYVAVTGLFYGLFLDGGRSLSRVAACFSLIGIAVLAVAGLCHMAPLVLIERGWNGEGAGLWLDLHGKLYGISLVFFGFYCLLIGLLLLRGRLAPWPVGALMMAGGATHLLLRTLSILDLALPDPLRPLALLPLLGEATLALQLLFAGVRKGRAA